MSDTPSTDKLYNTPFCDGHAAREAFLKHARALESAYGDLMGQIRAMKERSDQYFSEAPQGSDEADMHLRVSSVLQELHRLGEAFRNR